jgi:hypothetical protein
MLSQLNQHDKTTKHQGNMARYEKKNRAQKQKQQFINSKDKTGEKLAIPDQFSTDLAKALIGANIPLWKLTNKGFKEFLETYCGKAVPDESTLRRNYLSSCFQEVLKNIFLLTNFI